jgi:hypothetical protein
MSHVQDLLQLGVEVKRQGPSLRLVWHREPTPEIRELIRTKKEELLSELETPREVELSTEEPSDPEAANEFKSFSPGERRVFFGCRAVRLEEGAEFLRAERDAAAAILQRRRLSKPLPYAVVKALRQERQGQP